MTRLAAVAVLALLCASCSAPDLAALGEDKNADCLKVTTPWGSSVFDRNWGCESPPPTVTRP